MKNPEKRNEKGGLLANVADYKTAAKRYSNKNSSEKIAEKYFQRVLLLVTLWAFNRSVM